MYRRTSKVVGWPAFPTTAVVQLTETVLRVKRKKGRKKKERRGGYSWTHKDDAKLLVSREEKEMLLGDGIFSR